MKLVIGGRAQGKSDYVKANYPDCVVFDDFSEWFRQKLSQGEEPEREAEELVKRSPDMVIISDEVGSGIVPMDKFEREYRERLGRFLVKLADRSERVVRVFCGIGTVIK